MRRKERGEARMKTTQEPTITMKDATKSQVGVLLALYSYRFLSPELLQVHLAIKSRTTIYDRLKLLMSRGWIDRRHEPRDKLLGKPAAYYLTRIGMAQLKKHYDLEASVMKTIYNNATVSKEFIERKLMIAAVANELCRLYAKTGDFYTSNDLMEFRSIPDYTPDGYIKMRAKHYFVDVLDPNTPEFVMLRKVRAYIQHDESGEREEENGYPTILLICSSPRLQNYLHKKVRQLLYAHDAEFAVGVTTLEALKAAEDKKDKIWRSVTVKKGVVALNMVEKDEEDDYE